MGQSCVLNKLRKHLIVTILTLMGIGVAVAVVSRLALPDTVSLGNGQEVFRALVIGRSAGSSEQNKDTVYVHPLAGNEQGRSVPAVLPSSNTGVSLIGRAVFVEFRPNGDAVIVGVCRDRTLLWLTAILLGMIILVAGAAAPRFLLVLASGIGALLCVFVPCLFGGVSPIPAALLTAVGFQGAAAFLIGRDGRRICGILAGSAGGLSVATVLALVTVEAARLTGVYSALTKTLWYSPATRELNFPQLLVGGMIIGACGIILDLAAGITLAVNEVARANPGLNRRRLAGAGLAVGRDIMGTELTTLIFAYAGAHFGALLLPLFSPAAQGYEICALQMFSEQSVVIEIAAMLVGTIALIMTIPVTAAASALFLAARGQSETETENVRTLRTEHLDWRRIGGTICAIIAAWWICAQWHASLFHRYGTGDRSQPDRALVQATVASVVPPGAVLAARTDRLKGEAIQRARCKLVSGEQRGAIIEVDNAISGFPGHDRLLNPSDRVLLQTWCDRGRVIYSAVIDFSRSGWLIHLAFLTIGVVFLVGRANGLRGLAALLVCGIILYVALWLTAIGARRLPVLPVFLTAVLALCASVFAIIAGPTRKAAVGAAGAFGGLLAGGICAVIVSGQLALSGLESDAAAAIRNFTGADLDYRGLLQAGMVLGLAGAVMDVAIAIASATHEVCRAKPGISQWDLFRSGMQVGHGVMIPMMVVLTFAYVGLNLPILMLPKLFPGQSISILLSNERISVEILRILVGAIGLVATVPITALLSSLGKRRKTEADNAMA